MIRIEQLPPIPKQGFRKTSRPYDIFLRLRKSSVPKGGWTMESLSSVKGKNLLRDVMAVRRLAIRDNSIRLTKSLSDMIEQEIDEVLTKFVQELAKRENAQSKSIGSGLVGLVLNLFVAKGLEKLFEKVLSDVFKDENVEGRVIEVFKPPYTSVMASIADKTLTLLSTDEEAEDEEPTVEEQLRESGELPSASQPAVPPVRRREQPSNVVPVASINIGKPPRRVERELTKKELDKIITRKADKLCSKVTRISETTRKRMRKFFKDNIEGKATVREMIEKMKSEFKSIERSRIPTIVRNELSVAANEAQILSFKNTKTLTHCSVVGCQAVEDDGPKYKGFPTCNLQNVPVEDLEEVEFHINHTGSWVPTGFRNKDGSVPKLRLFNREGIGKKDDPKALRHRYKPLEVPPRRTPKKQPKKKPKKTRR